MRGRGERERERGRGREGDGQTGGGEKGERDINNNWHARMVQTARQPVATAREEQLSTFLTSRFDPRYLSTIILSAFLSQRLHMYSLCSTLKHSFLYILELNTASLQRQGNLSLKSNSDCSQHPYPSINKLHPLLGNSYMYYTHMSYGYRRHAPTSSV